MKRTLVMLLWLLAFICGATVVLGEEVTAKDVSKNDIFAFSFRNGITWDSTPEQIAIAENRNSEPVKINDWLLYMYNNIAVSNFRGDLHFVFSDENLLLAYYTFYRNPLSEDELLYLTEALISKYGQPSRPDMERLNVLMNAVEVAEYTISNLRNWQLDDGTYVAQFCIDNETDCIMYFNEAKMLRVRGIYNTAGL